MIFGTVHKTLAGLYDVLTNLDKDQYQSPCTHLSGSTIGQHVRHVGEHFQCVLIGYETGAVYYELRKRDIIIETNKKCALHCLSEILEVVSKTDMPMQLTVTFKG